MGARDTANLGTVTPGDTRAQQPDTAAGDATQNFLGSPDRAQRASSSLIASQEAEPVSRAAPHTLQGLPSALAGSDSRKTDRQNFRWG